MRANNTVILLSMFTFGLVSFSAQAVNIDITGTVVASPCEVNGGQDTLSVNLGDTIQADSLSGSGDTSDWKEFSLDVTNCPASTTSFTVAFSGTADTDATKYLNTGTATNLALEVTTQDGANNLGNGSSLNLVIPSATHSYSLPLRARAVSKGDVMPGTISSQVVATFTYQ